MTLVDAPGITNQSKSILRELSCPPFQLPPSLSLPTLSGTLCFRYSCSYLLLPILVHFLSHSPPPLPLFLQLISSFSHPLISISRRIYLCFSPLFCHLFFFFHPTTYYVFPLFYPCVLAIYIGWMERGICNIGVWPFPLFLSLQSLSLTRWPVACKKKLILHNASF